MYCKTEKTHRSNTSLKTETIALFTFYTPKGQRNKNVIPLSHNKEYASILWAWREYTLMDGPHEQTRRQRRKVLSLFTMEVSRLICMERTVNGKASDFIAPSPTQTNQRSREAGCKPLSWANQRTSRCRCKADELQLNAPDLRFAYNLTKMLRPVRLGVVTNAHYNLLQFYNICISPELCLKGLLMTWNKNVQVLNLNRQGRIMTPSHKSLSKDAQQPCRKLLLSLWVLIHLNQLQWLFI